MMVPNSAAADSVPAMTAAPPVITVMKALAVFSTSDGDQPGEWRHDAASQP